MADVNPLLQFIFDKNQDGKLDKGEAKLLREFSQQVGEDGTFYVLVDKSGIPHTLRDDKKRIQVNVFEDKKHLDQFLTLNNLSIDSFVAEYDLSGKNKSTHRIRFFSFGPVEPDWEKTNSVIGTPNFSALFDMREAHYKLKSSFEKNGKISLPELKSYFDGHNRKANFLLVREEERRELASYILPTISNPNLKKEDMRTMLETLASNSPKTFRLLHTDISHSRFEMKGTIPPLVDEEMNRILKQGSAAINDLVDAIEAICKRYKIDPPITLSFPIGSLAQMRNVEFRFGGDLVNITFEVIRNGNVLIDELETEKMQSITRALQTGRFTLSEESALMSKINTALRPLSKVIEKRLSSKKAGDTLSVGSYQITYDKRNEDRSSGALIDFSVYDKKGDLLLRVSANKYLLYGGPIKNSNESKNKVLPNGDSYNPKHLDQVLSAAKDITTELLRTKTSTKTY